MCTAPFLFLPTPHPITAPTNDTALSYSHTPPRHDTQPKTALPSRRGPAGPGGAGGVGGGAGGGAQSPPVRGGAWRWDGFVGGGGASCARRIRRRLNPFLYTRIMHAGQARLSSDPLHGRAQVLRQALPPLRRVAWCVLDVYVALIHRLIACQSVLGLPTDERFPIPPHPKTNQQARTPPTSTLTTPARPSARWRRCQRRCPPWRR